MGCYYEPEPEDEYKDWSKALISDEDKARFEELKAEKISNEDLYAMLQGKINYSSYYDESDVHEFADDYPDWYELLVSEIVYDRIMDENRARERAAREAEKALVSA